MTPRATPTARVAAQIVAGQHDAQFELILEAVQERVKQGGIAVRWRCDLPDLSFSEDDLTLDEALVIEQACGVTWNDIQPLASAKQMRTILEVTYQRRHPDADSAAWISVLTVPQVVAAFSTYVVDDRTEGSTPLVPADSPT